MAQTSGSSTTPLFPLLSTPLTPPRTISHQFLISLLEDGVYATGSLVSCHQAFVPVWCVVSWPCLYCMCTSSSPLSIPLPILTWPQFHTIPTSIAFTIYSLFPPFSSFPLPHFRNLLHALEMNAGASCAQNNIFSGLHAQHKVYSFLLIFPPPFLLLISALSPLRFVVLCIPSVISVWRMEICVFLETKMVC
jgi:hypothetical protein